MADKTLGIICQCHLGQFPLVKQAAVRKAANSLKWLFMQHVVDSGV